MKLFYSTQKRKNPYRSYSNEQLERFKVNATTGEESDAIKKEMNRRAKKKQ